MATALLFTGHMIDLPTREEARFPADREMAARSKIATEIDRFQGSPGAAGFSSGARGGDILFQEVCRERGIPATVVLPFPPETFVQKSVDGILGSTWRDRFWKIWRETSPSRQIVLDLPPDDTAYAQCNAFLLGLARGHGQVHLIALWDGKGGDGPGGTKDMVEKAGSTGDEPFIFSPRDL